MPIGEPFDLEARMGLSARFEQAERKAVAYYRLRLSGIIGRPCRTEPTFPLYYPGMPAYDAAWSALRDEERQAETTEKGQG